MMPVLQRKVLAYVTHGGRLLVFRRPESEAGIQVPAGTIEEGEEPIDAVLREAREETGLEDLTVDAFLGESVRTFPEPRPDFPSGVTYHRYIYHLRCHGNPPETWRHYEQFPSEGPSDPIPYDFFWVPLPDGVPELSANQGELLAALVALLKDPTKG
jgi:8-oxo-dGTP diphosphatase